MREIIFERDAINLPALHAALATVLHDRLIGLSTESDGAGVRLHVHLDDRPGDVDEAAIQAVIDAHDPALLTLDQQADADRAAILAGLDKPWADWTPADKDALLEVLAAQMGLGRESLPGVD